MNYKYLNLGTFGKKKIFYELIGKQYSSKRRFFFLHGAFTTTLKDKYINLAKDITKQKMGSVFLYETSRKIYSWEYCLEFEKYERTFEGKTFEEEKKDVENAFKHFLKITAIKNKNIVLIGFSLGGTLASFLLPKYKNLIQSIYLFGSSISTKRKKLPILSSYPKKQSILNNFKNFSGNIYLIQGEKDDVVPITEAKKILVVAKKSILKKNIILKDVDHRFNLIKNNKTIFIKEWIISLIKYTTFEEEVFNNLIKNRFI